MVTSASSNIAENESLEEQRQQVLELARRLDRLGRRAEMFLSRQFQQLEEELEEFEREKSAWRRQQQREMAQLERQRTELAGMANGRQPVKAVTTDVARRSVERRSSSAGISRERASERRILEQTARDSGVDPIRLLMQPGTAGPAMIASLLLEFSRLNRLIGGGGIRFELAESRLPPRRMFARKDSGVIVQLDGFSRMPLTESDAGGTFDVDTDEHLENWLTFKTQILQSALKDIQLVAASREAQPAPRHPQSRSLILESILRASDLELKDTDQNSRRPDPLRVNRRIDVVRQQVERLEISAESLSGSSGFRLHVSLQ